MNENCTIAQVAPTGGTAQKKDRSYLIWTFLLPFSLMLLIYFLRQVYPFGENSVLVLDLNGQYVGFYEALRAFIYGDGSMLYSFARSLGGEMMGIYAYLASPLSYLVALFPSDAITEALLFIFILKAGLCGLTFGLYLDRRGYSTPTATVMFSILYALGSFAVVMQHNSMWIDNLILLPLVTRGVEDLIRERRFKGYVCFLSLALLANFYIGYMTCIYVALYFFYFFYAYRHHDYNDPEHEPQHYARALLRMAFWSLVAIAIAAIILLTAAYSLSLGKNDFSDPNYTPYIKFDPFSFFSKLLPGVYDTVQPEGLPFAYCGIVTLLLVPLYFCNRAIARSERISSGVFLAVLYLSMSISTLDMLWHGGQDPNWLNYRYVFFLCFLLLVLASRGLARLGHSSDRALGGTVFVLLACLSVAASLQLSFFGWTEALISAALILFFALLLYLLRHGGERRRELVASLMLVAVTAETLCNGYVMLERLEEECGYTTREEYHAHYQSVSSLIARLEEYDPGFYRTETYTHRVTNDVMEIGYRGLTNSTSTLNQKTLLFLNRLGLLATSHWSTYQGSTLLTDSLLGIRYLFTDAFPSPYSFYETVLTEDRYRVYKNPYALPLAFTAADAIKDYDIATGKTPCDRLNGLASALCGKDLLLYIPQQETTAIEHATLESDVLDGVTYRLLLSDVYKENQEAIENGTAPDDLAAPDTKITFTTTVTQDGALYFYLPTDYGNKMALYMDGNYIDDVLDEDTQYLRKLGTYQAGDTVSVTLVMQETLFLYYLPDLPIFYVEDTDAIATAMQYLSHGGITLSQFTEDSFYGEITATSDRTVVQTTIPYDAGWRVTVDGEAVVPYETAEALLAFTIAPGSHTVSLEYRPQAWLWGRTITGIALALFLLAVLLEWLWQHGKLPRLAGTRCGRILALVMSDKPGMPLLPEWPEDPPSPEGGAPTSAALENPPDAEKGGDGAPDTPEEEEP